MAPPTKRGGGRKQHNPEHQRQTAWVPIIRRAGVKGVCWAAVKPPNPSPAGVAYDQVLTWREAEIKHGRVAMLAALAFPLAELYHWQVRGGLEVPSLALLNQLPLASLWPFWLGAAALAEIPSVRSFVDPEKAKGLWFYRLKPDHSPGDLGFDPLGLKPEDPDELDRLQTVVCSPLVAH